MGLARAVQRHRLQRRPGARDRGVGRRRRCRHAPGLRLETRPVRTGRPARPGLRRRAAARRGPGGAGAAGKGRRRNLLPRRRRPPAGLRRGRRLPPGRTAGRRAAARGYQARGRTGRKQRLGKPVGYRRRRGLFRGPHKDERAGPRCRDVASEIPENRGEGIQGPRALQRGEQFLRRRQSRPCAVRRQCRRLADDRGHARKRPEGDEGDEIRRLPGRRRAFGHGAGRRLRTAAPRRRGAGPCGDLCRPGRGRRRRAAGLGRLQGNAGPPHAGRKASERAAAAGCQSLRADLDGRGRQIGAGSAGHAYPARKRRHHHEPGPAALRS